MKDQTKHIEKLFESGNVLKNYKFQMTRFVTNSVACKHHNCRRWLAHLGGERKLKKVTNVVQNTYKIVIGLLSILYSLHMKISEHNFLEGFKTKLNL